MPTPLPGRDLDALLANVGWMRSLALQLCRDSHDAEDAAQTTWIAAARRPPADAGKLRSYLARTLRNVLRMQGRTSRRRERREGEVADRAATTMPGTSELVERAELHQRLVAAVLQLPPLERDVVLRHYFEGVDVADLARQLGRSMDAVRALLRRSRARLRGGLEQAGALRSLALLTVGPAVPAAALGPVLTTGAICMQWKPVLGAAAVIAAVCLFVPLTGVSSPATVAPPPAGESPVAAAADATGPAAPSSPVQAPPAPPARELAPPVRGTLRGRLVGTHPELAWSAPITVRATWREGAAERSHTGSASVGADGAFVMRLPAVLATGAPLRVECTAADPEHVPVARVFEVAVGNGEDDLQLAVEPLPTLLGSAVTADGTGIAAARVLVFAADHGVPRDRALADERTATDGIWRARLPAAGDVFVAVVGPDERAQLAAAGIGATVRGVTETGAIVLRPAAAVTGRVHWADNTAVSSGAVEWRAKSAVVLDKPLGLGWCAGGDLTQRHTAALDASGRFTLPVREGETGVVLVSRVEQSLPAGFTTAAATAPQEVDLRVEGRAITIRVLENGKPAGSVGVEWRRQGFAGNMGTDANGELRQIVLDGPFRARAVSRDDSLASEWVEFTSGPPDVVVLQLLSKDGEKVVVQLEGADLPQVSFRWQPTDGSPGRSMTLVAAAGRFTMRVPAGSHRLRLLPAGTASEYLLAAEHDVVVPPPDGVVTLPAQLGGKLRFSVTAAGGAFVAGSYRLARPDIAGNAARPASRRSIAGGSAAVAFDDRGPHVTEPLPPGTGELFVDLGRAGEHRQVVEIVAGRTTEVRIQLP